jgi:hypothetical protein
MLPVTFTFLSLPNTLILAPFLSVPLCVPVHFKPEQLLAASGSCRTASAQAGTPMRPGCAPLHRRA